MDYLARARNETSSLVLQNEETIENVFLLGIGGFMLLSLLLAGVSTCIQQKIVKYTKKNN